jgi:hypothetical protein
LKLCMISKFSNEFNLKSCHKDFLPDMQMRQD